MVHSNPYTFGLTESPDGALRLTLEGVLDAETVTRLWHPALEAVRRSGRRVFIVDASAVTACDGAGQAFLVALRQTALAVGVPFELRGLPERCRRLLASYEGWAMPPSVRRIRVGFVAETGRLAEALFRDLRDQITFAGALTAALVYGLAWPARLRWKDFLSVAERTGAEAFPLVAMLGFLLGLILAFQAAVPLRQYGADLFVANLVAISLIRELGPLVTAIVVAGRSGSAFAAEIGAMKINEELDALAVMGLEPVRFLVAPRVLAAVLMMPLLMVFADLFGLMGAAVVTRILGFPLVTFVNQVRSAVRITDLAGAALKTLVFGFLVAGVGCLRGLQTGQGPGAVGQAATRAMVSAIVLMVAADGLFAILFYCLGI